MREKTRSLITNLLPPTLSSLAEWRCCGSLRSNSRVASLLEASAFSSGSAVLAEVVWVRKALFLEGSIGR